MFAWFFPSISSKSKYWITWQLYFMCISSPSHSQKNGLVVAVFCFHHFHQQKMSANKRNMVQKNSHPHIRAMYYIYDIYLHIDCCLPIGILIVAIIPIHDIYMPVGTIVCRCKKRMCLHFFFSLCWFPVSVYDFWDFRMLQVTIANWGSRGATKTDLVETGGATTYSDLEGSKSHHILGCPVGS